MQKITDKIAALPPGQPFHSLEFFPPKTEMGFQNLTQRLERMALALRPLFVTVTWGAGGSTHAKSLQLAEACQRDLNLTTCLHLTCTNMSQSLIDEALDAAKAAGIRNILALRGDPPRNDEYSVMPDGVEKDREFVWAVDLVKYIRERHGDYFCIGVAGYPEGHAEGTYPEVQDPLHDLPYLIEKTKAGADFIMTQLFFDVDKYIAYENLLREDPSGVFKDIVIIPGLMPIQSYQILRRTTKLSHASLPADILARLDAVKNDDSKVKEVGVDILSEIIGKVRGTPSLRGPSGFHFYTLNLEKAVTFVLERCKLIPDAPVFEEVDTYGAFVNGGAKRNRRASSVASDPHNHLIVDSVDGRNDKSRLEPADAAGQLQNTAVLEQRPDVTLAIMEGEGALGREATWDDFPNGRFGDARSPAFGDIDGYGPSIHMSRKQALELWGYPVEPGDITKLFVDHIDGKLNSIPWSEEGLTAESKLIHDELVTLNRKGWWTVASQPAVNGERSDHETFGWGPHNGFVFQKAFVEFFVSPSDWSRLERGLRETDEIVSFYAANKRGDYASNMPGSDASMNAVTWGVFPGKEIISPTIIEEVSFKSWRDEAFGIWREWSLVYPPRSASAKFLGDVANDYWLVNVIHHEYSRPQALWDFLAQL